MFSQNMSLSFPLHFLWIYSLFRQTSGVNFIAECVPNLIDQQYGYNISCHFNITATSFSINLISLNWTLPSQSSFLFDNNTHFVGGQNPANSYQGSQALATWDAINVSSTAILAVYLQPNASITRNQVVTSTVTLRYHNASNAATTLSVESAFLPQTHSMPFHSSPS